MVGLNLPKRMLSARKCKYLKVLQINLKKKKKKKKKYTSRIFFLFFRCKFFVASRHNDVFLSQQKVHTTMDDTGRKTMFLRADILRLGGVVNSLFFPLPSVTRWSLTRVLMRHFAYIIAAKYKFSMTFGFWLLIFFLWQLEAVLCSKSTTRILLGMRIVQMFDPEKLLLNVVRCFLFIFIPTSAGLRLAPMKGLRG